MGIYTLQITHPLYVNFYWPILIVMENLKDILTPPKTIALVGASNNPERPSFSIMKMLLEEGFNVIPINPNESEIWGKTVYKSLLDMPVELQKTIDIVNVFRRPAQTPEVARQAATIDAPVLWLQLGIVNDEAKQIAQDNNIQFIQDHCIAVEYRLNKPH